FLAGFGEPNYADLSSSVFHSRATRRDHGDWVMQALLRFGYPVRPSTTTHRLACEEDICCRLVASRTAREQVSWDDVRRSQCFFPIRDTSGSGVVSPSVVATTIVHYP